MAIRGQSYIRARNSLMREEPFKTYGALYADNSRLTNWDMGRLPQEFYNSAKTARYVVFSYSTPIAWVTESGEVVIPDVKYSLTTTIHQGLCLSWLKAKSSE